MSEIVENEFPLRKTPIAIVGMACIYPMSRDLTEYWNNIIDKKYCITDIPPSHWSVNDYYDDNPQTPDKTYCKKGGFIPDIDFDPTEFGIPPNSLEAIDTSQLLALIVAKNVLKDTGYDLDKLERENIGVILGATIPMQLAITLKSRLEMPILKKVLVSSGISDEDAEKICEKMKKAYVDWQEGSFPGLLSNVIAGRIANRLDLGGTNLTIDAACASSLGAVKMAISELVEHRCDLMITGGVDTENDIFSYLCFSKTPVLSKKQFIRPFDAESDGTLISEGVGMVVLKRLEDAVRDNDRIYAVIKGIGSSSDGRANSIYAPNTKGQQKALRVAYKEAGFDASSVSLIEAHGTGTSAGDITEFDTLKEIFSDDSSPKQHIALGTVKSQIGHTKAAAGIAGLIKTTLALYHKVLPPTINIVQPNPKMDIENSAFYLNTETRPWIRKKGDPPRRAGVNSFGFGGTNFHVVLEEYGENTKTDYRLHNTIQVFFLCDENSQKLKLKCKEVLKKLESGTKEEYFNELVENCKSQNIPQKWARIGFTVNSADMAIEFLGAAEKMLDEKADEDDWKDYRGIYFRRFGIDDSKKTVALFSGQGSQYPNMGRELLNSFPCMQEVFSHFDSLLTNDRMKALTDVVYPIPSFGLDKNAAENSMLRRTEYAQPAIGALSLGLYKVFEYSGFKPDFVAGHSFGEMTALRAAGVMDDENYYSLVKSCGQAIMAVPSGEGFDAGKMLAVKGDINKIMEILKDFTKVTIANWNSNEQIVLAGPTDDIQRVNIGLKEIGIYAVLLPVAVAFHTPLINYASKLFEGAVDAVKINKPCTTLFSNTTAKPYPDSLSSIRENIKNHMLSPVNFKEEIENIYNAGGYVFIEFGPKKVLTNIVKSILKNKSHISVAINPNTQKDSVRQLYEAYMKLKVIGLRLGDIDPYMVKKQKKAVLSGKTLPVRINGHLYTSEKTKKAFENELKNGFKIASLYNGKVEYNCPKAVNRSVSPGLSAVKEATAVAGCNTGNELNMLEERLTVKEQKNKFDTSLSHDIAGFINEIKSQQNKSLEIHREFLNNQSEYANQFLKLLGEISSSPEDNTGSGLIAAFDSHLSQHHNYQLKILKVHEEYLNNIEQYNNKLLDFVEDLIHTKSKNGDVVNTSGLLSESGIGIIPGRDSASSTFKQESIEILRPSETVPLVHDSQPDFIGTKGKEPIRSEMSKQADAEKITSLLLSIVSEKTGYPTETLELDLDVEADLGIDSLKRFEIMGAMRDVLPGIPNTDSEVMFGMKTLKSIADYLCSSVGSLDPTPVSGSGVEIMPGRDSV